VTTSHVKRSRTWPGLLKTNASWKNHCLLTIFRLNSGYKPSEEEDLSMDREARREE